MNKGINIILGLIVVLGFSWWGMVFSPLKGVGSQEPVFVEMLGQYYPTKRPGQANQGREVYRQLGCVSCHTQNVLPEGLSPDIKRGWGPRRSVAQDYLYDSPVMLGSVRIGPDLASMGTRIEADTPEATEENIIQQLKHLYDPTITSPGSVMPPFPFLFDVMPEEKATAPYTLHISGKYGVRPGYVVVPKPDALALIAYLRSLRTDTALFEAPISNE